MIFGTGVRRHVEDLWIGITDDDRVRYEAEFISKWGTAWRERLRHRCDHRCGVCGELRRSGLLTVVVIEYMVLGILVHRLVDASLFRCRSCLPVAGSLEVRSND